MSLQRGLVGLLAFLALGLVGCQGARLVVPVSLEPAGLVVPEDYVREFAPRGDGERIFERLFGQTLGAFEREVLEGLATPRQ
jgi:hypothetical protein